MKSALVIALLALGCAGLAGAATPATALQGEVLEVREVDIYTYLRLKTKDGETWAAVTKVPVKKGAQVTIANPMVMQNFESKTLKKTFDKIVFGTIVDPNAPATPATAATSMLPHGPMAAAPKASAPAPVVKVAKATGADARTVAEVVGGKAALKDKSVSLRGQIVKANIGIMGKNWFHVQDGTGSAAAGTHDVLVTSKEKAAVGDVVTVKGTVRTDVKLGAGYDYAVLIENAALGK
ncbi:MAG: nucleotide-binding protein [Rubrivivax sp.]|nr:nucleotide-binding protein [Rubrivivax sp.]